MTPTPTCSCLLCGRLTDAPYCEVCERELEPLTIEAVDALYAEHSHREPTRAQREGREK